MKSVPVNSRIIQNVLLHQEDGQLHICFKNGEERLFIGVPEHEVTAMCVAKSPGSIISIASAISINVSLPKSSEGRVQTCGY